MPTILGLGDDEEVTLDGALDGSRAGLDRHKVSDSIYQQMQEERFDFGIAPDGLPRPIVKSGLPLAPVLDAKTFVCMADTSEFVVRDRWGEVLLRFTPDQVERTEGGAYRVLRSSVVKLLPSLSDRGADTGNDDKYLKVEPLRPQCRHYARQMTDFADNPGARFVERVCTARRDSGGEFLSLRDSCMYACELRTPRHSVSEKTLDAFDDEKVKLGRERIEAEQSFDVDAALAAITEEETK
jgi:hypothetical protein